VRPIIAQDQSFFKLNLNFVFKTNWKKLELETKSYPPLRTGLELIFIMWVGGGSSKNHF
jgi:hypothetical protein